MDGNRRQVLKAVGTALGCSVLPATGVASGRDRGPDGRYTVDSNLKQDVAITGRELDEAIRAVSPGSPLIGLGRTFLEVQDRNGIDAVYQTAHAAHESNWGRSRIARTKNNLFGWSAFDRCPGACADSFRSYAACVRQVMGYVDDDYLSPGGSFYEGPTLRGMNVNYATDPYWAEKIAKIMRRLDANLDADGSAGTGESRIPSRFTVGEAFITKRRSNLRTDPGMGYDVIWTYPRFATGVVLDGPVRAGGRLFWKVEFDNGNLTGWTPQEGLNVYGNAGGDYRFPRRMRVRTTHIANARWVAGEDGIVNARLDKDSAGYVRRGPVVVDGKIWYNVGFNAGVAGWCRAGVLTAAPIVSDDAAFGPDTRVQLQRAAVYHTAPGPDQTVVRRVAAGDVGYVRAGPVSNGGYDWWFVDFNTGFGGWIAQRHVREATLPELEQGIRVELIRDAAGHYLPGPSTNVSKVFDQHTEGYVRDGPVDEGGYDWWRVALNTGETAWFAGKHLAVDFGAFDWSDEVETTAALSVRAANSEESERIAVAREGTTGRIRQGPEPNGDWNWWKVEFPDATGWVVQKYIRETPDSGDDDDSRRSNGFVWPLSGRVTSGFNDTRIRNGRREKHKSIDIAGATGTPIVASYPGRVSVVADGGNGGKKVFVDHGDGWRTEYHHLSAFAVSRGETVEQGDVVGYVGSTGRSRGSHLHFEVVENGRNRYVPVEAGDRVAKNSELPGDYL